MSTNSSSFSHSFVVFAGGRGEVEFTVVRICGEGELVIVLHWQGGGGNDLWVTVEVAGGHGIPFVENVLLVEKGEDGPHSVSFVFFESCGTCSYFYFPDDVFVYAGSKEADHGLVILVISRRL